MGTIWNCFWKCSDSVVLFAFRFNIYHSKVLIKNLVRKQSILVASAWEKQIRSISVSKIWMCFYAWYKIIGNKLPRMKKIMGCLELGKWFGDHSSVYCHASIKSRIDCEFWLGVYYIILISHSAVLWACFSNFRAKRKFTMKNCN
jgi:hypothetical protein